MPEPVLLVVKNGRNTSLRTSAGMGRPSLLTHKDPFQYSGLLLSPTAVTSGDSCITAIRVRCTGLLL